MYMSQTRTCVKCSGDSHPKWVRKYEHCGIVKFVIPEHMLYTCEVCGYVWREEFKD